LKRAGPWSSSLGYREAMFLNEGRFRPISEFDLDRHQLAHADTPNVAGYCGNFLFTP
jgi:hypothetical protein